LRIQVRVLRLLDHFSDQDSGEEVRVEVVSEPKSLTASELSIAGFKQCDGAEGSNQLKVLVFPENPVVSESTAWAASGTESGFSGVDMHGL